MKKIDRCDLCKFFTCFDIRNFGTCGNGQKMWLFFGKHQACKFFKPSSDFNVMYKLIKTCPDCRRLGEESYCTCQFKEPCDLQICKQYKNGYCMASNEDQCPKNNQQSIYEKPEFLKEYIKLPCL